MTPQLRTLLTIIRDKETKRNDFIFYADRINRLLVEEGLNFLPVREKTVETRTEEKYVGSEFIGKICAVPIIRAGLSMENSIREVAKKIRIAHILIHIYLRVIRKKLRVIKYGLVWLYATLLYDKLAVYHPEHIYNHGY